MRRILQLASFEAFRHPGFGALWIGALISNIGGWMSAVALGVAVTENTGKAASTAMVAAMTFIPSMLLAPTAGALADRFERRRYLGILNTIQIAVAATLAVMAFTGTLSVGAMSALAFCTGCANTLANPAFVALTAELVPAEALPNALSLNSAQFNLGRIVGPALATVVFAVAGAPWAFVGNALSFGAVVWALWRLPPPDARAERSRTSLWRGILEGVEIARADPGIRLSLGAVLGVAVLVAPFIGMIPVYAIQVFGQGAQTASLFTTAQGIGAVVMALAMGPLVARFGIRTVALCSAFCLGPCALLYWSAPSPGLAALLIAPLGGAYLATLISFNTIQQLRTPRSAQARVSGLHSMVLGGGYALGLLLLGPLADRYGLQHTLGAAALLFIAGVTLTRVLAPQGVGALQPAQAAAAAAAAAKAPLPPPLGPRAREKGTGYF